MKNENKEKTKKQKTEQNYSIAYFNKLLNMVKKEIKVGKTK